MTRFDSNDDQLVVIIGSGAGGGTIAADLCKAGINVVLLEAGPSIGPDDYLQDEVAAYEQLAWKDDRVASGSWQVARDYPSRPTWVCKVLGGTSVHWSGMALRAAEHELKALSTYGPIEGANLADWPIPYEELVPWYEKAESRMGVTGRNGIPDHPTTNHSKVFFYGAKRAGYKQLSRGHLAINSVPFDGRPASGQDGFTMQGDRRRAKWSSAYVEIPKAAATGRLDLRDRCHAVLIEHNEVGRATSVVYVDAKGTRQRQKCRAVVIAGNAIETPRILLASASGRFSRGLANGSDNVGRHYMRHLTASTWSVFEKPVRMYRGEAMPGLVSDEARHDPSRGFVGGYYIQLLSLSLPAVASAVRPGWWGKEFAWTMEHYGSMAGLFGLGEDLPRATNRVTIDSKRVDAFGVPLPVIHYDEHSNDLLMQQHCYNSMHRIHTSAGAIKCVDAPPFPASHNMGTTRMSRHPADGVVDLFGRTHEIPNLYIGDGSVFPTSAAANPTLTIVALASRQAQKIARDLTSGSSI